MELDRICQNCSLFFQDSEEMEIGFCMNDEDFAPFMDDIIENEDFSRCYELYLKKRYNGDKEACENFELPEIIELPEGMDLSAYLNIEHLKNYDVRAIEENLYHSDFRIVSHAVNAISEYVRFGNERAYEALLDFYIGLGPAEFLDDVHLRKEIVNLLSTNESESKTIEAYINELERSPSNTRTRQLYSLILDRLDRHPNEELVSRLLLGLMDRKKFSKKMKDRILDIIYK